MATDRQIAFLTSLVSQSAYPSVIDAIDGYGLGLRTARDLTVGEASEMIDFLTGKPHRATIAPVVKPVKAAKTGPNKGGRVGMTASLALTRTCSVTGTVVSDTGKKVRVQFFDGSLGSYDPARLTFA